jgi:hypothetical protein
MVARRIARVGSPLTRGSVSSTTRPRCRVRPCHPSPASKPAVPGMPCRVAPAAPTTSCAGATAPGGRRLAPAGSPLPDGRVAGAPPPGGGREGVPRPWQARLARRPDRAGQARWRLLRPGQCEAALRAGPYVEDRGAEPVAEEIRRALTAAAGFHGPAAQSARPASHT